MTESEKKEYERIQAKIVNKLAIVLGCAGIIFVIWVYFYVRDRDRSLRIIQNIRQPILRKYQEGPKAVPVCH
mgnify:CR=1 FL=1